MANQQGNGRNRMADDDRSSWRQDDDEPMSMRGRDRNEEPMSRDRFRDDERFMQRDRERHGASWDDRSSRGWDREDSRSGGWRSIDRGGPGQSGYGSGREGDRERFLIGHAHEDSQYLAQGGQQMGGWGNDMGHGAQPDRHRGQSWGMHQQGIQYDDGQGHRMGYGQESGYGQQRQQRYGHVWPQQQSDYDPRYSDRDMRGGEERESIGPHIKGRFQGHRGKGPAGYTRSDERIKETVCEALTDDDRVDATNIEITVKNGEVTLAGTVEDRMQKRMAEDCVENLSGVKDVQNQLRVVSDPTRRGSMMSSSTSSTESSPLTGTNPTTSGQNGTEKRGRA